MPQRRRFAKNSEGVRRFKLVARPQGGEEEEEDTGALVLEPFVKPGDRKRTGLSHDELLAIPESFQSQGGAFYGQEAEDRRLARSAAATERGVGKGYGGDGDDEDLDDPLDGDCYFPLDGYNYEQHMATCSGGKKGGVVGVVLPAPTLVEDVPEEPDINHQKATTQEEEELLRALEYADEYEELEEEDFEELGPEGVPAEVLWGPAAADYMDMPDLTAMRAEHSMLLAARGNGNGDEMEGSDEENEEDERHEDGEDFKSFDKFLDDEYGDEELGELCDEEIEGHISLEQCTEVLDEYIQEKDDEYKLLRSLNEPQRSTLPKDDVPRVIDETRAIIAKYYEEEMSGSETESGESSEDETKDCDCETVLTTLSNLSNRPGKIGKIKVIKKPAPLKPVQEDKDDEEEEEEDEKAVRELPDVITERSKGETAEEKRARKASVKEMRRVCREMKKESKELYKNEAMKLPGQQKRSGDVRPRSRVIRLE